jgi:hypothetical protein
MDHIFMHCDRSSKVWFGSQLGIKFDSSQTSFADWVTYSINHLKEENIILLAAIIYGIWYARNQQVFEGRDILEWDTIAKASQSIIEYQQATSREGPRQPNYVTQGPNRHHQQLAKPSRMHKWTKPEEGCIKINCDANLTRADRWGLGAVCRDSNGELVAAATWDMDGANDPALAEAFAIYNAVLLALDCCFRNVVIECDCLKVVSLVNRDDLVPRSYLGKIVHGIKNCIRGFRSCRVRHIRREANQTAHALAYLAHEEPNRVWLEDTPPKL